LFVSAEWIFCVRPKQLFKTELVTKRHGNYTAVSLQEVYRYGGPITKVLQGEERFRTFRICLRYLCYLYNGHSQSERCYETIYPDDGEDGPHPETKEIYVECSGLLLRVVERMDQQRIQMNTL
jgi:hypothetical protein